MDELVHHCLRELAFDGDLGCHPSRLRDFVAGYYSDSLQQVVDDAYFAFVWSLVVSQPTVRVGTVPDGNTTEVYIAPQQSQKRKVKSNVDDTPPVTLLALPPDARSTTLDDLQVKHGETLRVAVDAETSFAAITGSHNRPPKLTPMVYTALQFITRGREHGISTVDLGKKTGYDQKTCFYLIKQLLELELVVKLRCGGVGTNFCVHKYFFERSPLWRQIQGEGASLSKDTRADEGGLDNEETAISPDGFQTPVKFDPMDARHLSSLSLIQSRVVKLLKNCKSYTHPSQNLLVKLGFSNPTKTDRRFFQSRLRELIESRVVERVVLPSTARSGQGEIPCIRLVPDTTNSTNGLNESPATVTREPESSMYDVPDHQSSTIKLNITLHKQIVDLLESAGTKGMTLSEISGALGNFDRRTLELLLTKLEKVPPPTHLSDLGIAQLMETHGRERRWRYFTVASYRTIIANENLDDQDGPYSSADFSNVGNFAPLVADDFYGDPTELDRFMDYAFNRVARPEDNADETAYTSAKSVGPITLSGSTVRGKKRRREEAGLGTDADIGTGRTPRKRGRPRKHPLGGPHDAPSIAKIVTPPRESRRGPYDLEESRGVPQLGGASRELRDASTGGQVPSLGAPKKRRRPSHDNYVAPEGSSPPGRRDGPSMRPPSPPLAGERVEHPRSRNGVHTTLVEEPVIPRTASLEPVSAGKKLKEKSAVPHPRSNVSLLRRENEFLRILEESGGITHPGSKEFLDAHLTLLDTLASAGEPTSGLPGVKVDKRTIESTFESLERRSKVKVLKTAISTTTGAQRPIRIIYFPTVDQSQLDAFLTELGKGPHSAPYSANTPSVVGALPGNPKARRPAQPPRQLQPEQKADNIGHWPKNSGRTDQLFESDDQTIHDVLLTERSTLAQLYGFIPGKMTRARELHLVTFQSWPDLPIPASPIERIMNFSRFLQGLPVGTYCSLISTAVHSDELSQLLSTEEGRRMSVKDLPQSLQTLLQIARSRSRERLLELFVILYQLNLIVPLQPTRSHDRSTDSESSNAVPSSFEPFTGNVSPISYRSAPDFWLFKHDAPLHLWALSTESPPFWKIVSICTRSDALSYWSELQLACESKTFAQSATQGGPSRSITPDPAFARFINRDTSWNRIYDLSWHQCQYLKRCISRQMGDSPLRDEESNLDLERISWTISAPLSVVKDFLEKERVSQQRGLDKVNLLTLENDQDEGHTGKIAQAKELLVQKVAGEKMRKEREWGAILKAVHPHALEGAAAIRVARVRKRYLQSGVSSDKSRWEEEVRDAIRDLESAAKRVLPFARRTVLARPPRSLASVALAAQPPAGLATPLSPAGLPPIVASQPGKTIEQLITEQGPAREDAGNKKRKSKKSKDANLEDGNGNDDDQTHRRSRFQWNKDYDELAQDASAILRVRSRETGTRMDWFALSQIFPAVPKNSVRQRVASLRELQSNEIYMRRLEEQWTRLWKQYRGTEHLPDPNPRNQSNFDLIKHLQFLRRFVDKNALRVGFQETATSFILPETVSTLQSSWDVRVQPNDNPTWEFLWDSRIDSNREKGLLQIAFTTESQEMPISDANGNREIQVAEAALKVVFGTPSEDYDPLRAANLLRSVGEEQLVSRAKDNLLSRGVLSKLVKDLNKPKPGRTLKISEINQNALGGSIVQDLFQDATTLDTLCKDRNGWREWPLSASDGDLAMLAQMMSEGLVDFRVDIADAKAARTEIDWNSKKADDDHIETTIFVRFENASDADDVTESRVQTPLPEKDDNNAGHGKTLEGTAACCRKYSDGLVDCNSCLDLALGEWFARSNAKEREACRHVLSTLEAAGPTGLDMNTLVTKSMGQDDIECVVSVLESLMNNTVPLVVRVGHVQPRIVLSSQSAPWTAVVNEDPRINVLPRRWLNSTGEKVRETWRAALRAVIGTVVFRPGITQAEIIWRLRSVYDGAEVIDALRQLCEDGFLRRREGRNERIWEVGLVPVTEKQEKQVFWFLGDRRWYHTGVAK